MMKRGKAESFLWAMQIVAALPMIVVWIQRGDWAWVVCLAVIALALPALFEFVQRDWFWTMFKMEMKHPDQMIIHDLLKHSTPCWKKPCSDAWYITEWEMRNA